MKKKTLLAASGWILALAILDQTTKWLIERTFDLGERVVVIPGFLEITNHRNYGASWGILQGQQTFLVIITVVALLVFIALFSTADFQKKFFYSTGLLLLIAGGTGNLVDRLFRADQAGDTFVLDFIDVYIFGYDFPIFNVADACLTVGMVLFAIDLLFLERRRVGRDG